MTVDFSRDRWARGTPGGLGIVSVAPTVTFGGQTIYFDTINTAQVGLNPDDGPSPRQPRIAVTNVASLEWEHLAWSREVWIEDYQTSTGMAKLTTGYDGYLVDPHYRHHPEILQPLEHTTVRVKVELAEPVPDGMVGTLHREVVTKLAGETYGRQFRRGQRPAPNSLVAASKDCPNLRWTGGVRG